jgi:hypothetical protein
MKTIYKVTSTILGVSALCGALFTSKAANADCSVQEDVYAYSTNTPQQSTDECTQGTYSSWIGYQANVGSFSGCYGTDYFVESNGHDGYYAGAWTYCSNSQQWYNSGYVGPVYTQGNFSGGCLSGTQMSCPNNLAGSAQEVEAYVYLW